MFAGWYGPFAGRTLRFLIVGNFVNIAAQFKTDVFLLTQMGSISSSLLNTSVLIFIEKKNREKSFQKILNTLRCDIIIMCGMVTSFCTIK